MTGDTEIKKADLLPQAVALEASIVSAKSDQGVLALAEDQF